MIYQWAGLEDIFRNLHLEIYDIDLKVKNDDKYCIDGVERKGASGKTSWYVPLGFEESARYGAEKNKRCGLKIIKYPVYADINDEYHRLLNEYSIQKILKKYDMAPDIYSLFLIRNMNKTFISFEWFPEKIEIPEKSIMFAQLVEHIENQPFESDIDVSENGIPYGKIVNEFISKCVELRIVPYDINTENLFFEGNKLKVIDVHKWKRSYSVISPSVPKYLQIELNNSCNAKCQMCNIPSMKRKKGMMDDDLFIKILKEANESGVEYITPFLHGEPFIRSDFLEKLSMINEYVPTAKITIFTNASLFSVEIAEKISKIKNIEEIVFSFPGGNKETYEMVTGLTYENSVNNIKNAFRILNNISMRISMPVFDKNALSVQDFYSLWENYPCSAYDTYNYIGDVSNTLSDECYEQCDRAFRSMTVMYDGRICLCCMDSEGKYVMGNIRENTLLEIWNNERYCELRNLHGICRNAYLPCSKCTLDLKTEEYKNAICCNNV